MAVMFMVKGEGTFPCIEKINCIYASDGAEAIAKEEDGSRMVRLYTEEIDDGLHAHFADGGWTIVATLAV